MSEPQAHCPSCRRKAEIVAGRYGEHHRRGRQGGRCPSVRRAGCGRIGACGVMDLAGLIRAELRSGYWKLSRQTSSAADKGARMVEALLDLHQPFKVYDDCGHDHAFGEDGVIERFDGLLVCDAAHTQTICVHCCTKDFGQSDACASDHDHDPHGPCKTVRVIAEQLDLLAEVNHDSTG